MAYILINRAQVQAIQDQLECVTGQPFQMKVVENTETSLLCAWQNETHVDYLLHVIAYRDRTYQVALAIQKYRTIETRFDRRLDQLQARRLFGDPRQCVRYMTGQILDTARL